ncbi:MAG: hypothetical protein RJA36_2718 [Pseudomonadota bacterium]|jgi:hypothetical protein
MKKIVLLLIVAGFAWKGLTGWESRHAASKTQPAIDTPARTHIQPAQPSFQCDGRTHCSQMRSCEEATYFLQHCPGVRMDGNKDGIPCESQWCRP